MRNLTIVNTEFNTEHGFFWVEFNNGKSIQCCLVARKDGNGCTKQIDRNDCGSNEGLSFDNNEWALNEDNDFAEINDLMFKEAKKLGIKII